MGFRQRNENSGLNGLVEAGVATLRSDNEVRELIDLIIKHGEDNPLGNKAHLFATDDFKQFFDYAVANKIDFGNNPVEEVIKKSRNKA